MASIVPQPIELSNQPTQRVLKVRRDYNRWVADESLEDYALRFTPSSFRKWSIPRISNTASGAITFLVLEAIGGSIAVNYGFINSFWAILFVGLVIFTTGLPISYYAAKYNVDMDLLTRGAGFGYIGSTISSFIYASFTFILFALEASIMAYALKLAFHIPLSLGYLLSALVVVPIVTHGVTLISRVQMITQPIWFLLMALPFIYILHKDPTVISHLEHFQGKSENGASFNFALFGAAMAVGVALITQIGEQVDYLRFMPKKTKQNATAWNLGVLIAGPGWILIGILKMLGGALLAYLAVEAGRSYEFAANPTNMYLFGFEQVFSSPKVAIIVTAIFVIISQIKINMTNAYAGSLAWSNFFARLTHSHPGRIVWVIFNTLIAIMLMEMDVFSALDQVLGLYSSIAISWIAVVFADLIINKPLGLSPEGIEFRRAYLYDINPVGVGAMLIASTLAIATFAGILGDQLRPFSAIIALITALITTPLLAYLTKGKYYISRQPFKFPASYKTVECTICGIKYEKPDMAYCPAYQGNICSLCCSLDARCHDSCKPHGSISTQYELLIKRFIPRSIWTHLESGLGSYIFLMIFTLSFLAVLLGMIYFHEKTLIIQTHPIVLDHLRAGFLKAYVVLVFATALVMWWLVLTAKSRRVAQEESNRQTDLLLKEIELHKKTDHELQQAISLAESANQAKSRYITGISHELRTPLNSILGYAQLLDADKEIPESKKNAIKVVKRSGEHLLSLIEGTLDISKIESGKLTLDSKPIKFSDLMNQIASMFEIQAKNKGLIFNYEVIGDLPYLVKGDQKRLTQILINILGNAVKFTQVGTVNFKISYAREFASIEISDTGPGIPESEKEKIFEPFIRGSSTAKNLVGGTGLGLTICNLLVRLMGGTMALKSTVGKGTTFDIRLFLPKVYDQTLASEILIKNPIGYKGPRKKILIVDNEEVDRSFLKSVLAPIGFELSEAENGEDCVKKYQSIMPDLILMDLAMPVMDGWEASYMIKKIHRSEIPIAIVSANAFDKGLENNAEITAEDFIVKPVNIPELLSWVQTKLNIEWIFEEFIPPKLKMSEDILMPSADFISELVQLLDVGYHKGILDKLNSLTQKKYVRFVDQMKKLAERFQYEQMKTLLLGKQKDSQ